MASIGYDPADNATAKIPASLMGVDYSTYLYGTSLKGMRFGLIETFLNFTASNETTPVINAIAAMVTELTNAGATVVPINNTLFNPATLSATLDVQSYEYRENMDGYLSSPTIGGTHPSSLTQLYLNSSGEFLVIPSQYSFINKSLASSTNDPNYAVAKLGIANLTLAVEEIFISQGLDAFIYPEQQNLVVKIGSPGQSGRNGILAALIGSPVAIVPAGFSPPTSDAPIGVPIGMEIMGLPWSEGKLFGIAAELEKLKHFRTMPAFANTSVTVCSNTSTIPTITPARGNLSPNYPVGKL
jgi:Asp-tRNA(Asn)/Glu-tRNA(Gln) amidotransferase A subunit family amidase